jgi:uncharacterized damage-inducible protein DinB
MKKSDIVKMPEYFDRYINLTDDVSLEEAFQISLRELNELPISKFEALGDKVYAPNKWTIKDILQHMVDTERIFAYRALAFSRNEPSAMLSFDEDLYSKNADASHRSLNDIISESKLVRQSFIELYKSFTDEMLLKVGRGFTGEYSVLSIGFLIAGHQRWHLRVIEEKYFPLLKNSELTE